MKKVINILMAISLILLFTIAPSVYASEKKISDITILEVYQPEESNEVAKVIYIDKEIEKQKKSKNFSTQGEIYEVYDHSYYVYGSSTLKQMNVGPKMNETFLISVAKGQTSTLSEAIEVSGTISYTGSVEGGIKNVINLKWSGTVSGTVTKTWGTTETYVGPPETSIYKFEELL